MLLPRTLARSLAGEVGAYAGIGCVAFLAILTVQSLAQRLEDLAAVGLLWSDTLGVVRWLLPMVGAYAVPMGFLFGVLAAAGRMSADAEVTAMRACGLGLGALLGPVLLVAAAVSALTALLMLHYEPLARRELRAVFREVASRGGILEPGEFKSLGDRVIFVQSRDIDNQLGGILISDHRDPQRPFLVFAESGRFVFDADQLAIRLELANGDVHIETRGSGRHQRIAFQHLDYTIDASSLLDRSRNVRPREMNLAELSASIARAEQDPQPPDVPARDPNEYRTQLHRRIALPFAPILFAALGVPLGLGRPRAARSWGVLVCTALVVVYYTLLTFSEFLGSSGALPPALALWIPNVVFGAAALPLLWRAQRGAS
jgi:lipopolysaccharide export system permease protein